MKSTALSAEVARRSAFALAHAAPRSPPGPFRKIVADNFFPVIGIRATVNLAGVRWRTSGRSSRPRRRKNWRKRDSGSTDRQPLDFPRNGQGKSLEILGKVWKSLEFPWNFLGKIWKSWEKLGATAIGYSTPNGPASAGERGSRRAARRRKIVTQAVENKPSRPKSGAGLGRFGRRLRRCALRHERREANPCGARVGAREPLLPTQCSPMISASSV